ncbi:hypothetical protein [Nocardia sp. NPDC059239]|uniref:hypothetical protein n=1 Tax=Nocardia sp. NPDC059239 TaxID=3346785 RepID=UPI0036820885
MGTTGWMAGEGPLVEFAAGFEQELLARGHKPGAIAKHLGLMGQLNRWMTSTDLAAGDLGAAVLEQFLAEARASGRRRVPTMATASTPTGRSRNEPWPAPHHRPPNPAATSPRTTYSPSWRAL